MVLSVHVITTFTCLANSTGYIIVAAAACQTQSNEGLLRFHCEAPVSKHVATPIDTRVEFASPSTLEMLNFFVVDALDASDAEQLACSRDVTLVDGFYYATDCTAQRKRSQQRTVGDVTTKRKLLNADVIQVMQTEMESIRVG